MVVTYFYRPKMKNAHSIEGVFHILKQQLRAHVTVQDYYCTHKWKRLHSFIQARKFQGDLNHITGDVHSLSLFLSSKKTVLTIHDIGHYERDLRGIRKSIFKRIWLTWPGKRVSAITTLSSFTKEKLVRECGIPAEKIHIIPNPAALDFAYHEQTFNEQQPAILQIGGGNNKNIYRLIEAVKGLNCKLILIRRFDPALENLLKSHNILFEWHSDISREEVYACYKKCDLLFFASEYEGFGVPILEANRVGRPVITSNISSMPEVAGKSALLVDPYCVAEIREAVLRIIHEPELRRELVTRGLENVKRYDPEVIAKQYLAIYNRVLENKKI